MTATAEHVINKAAGDLGRWIPGEALGAVEHDVISNALDNVLAEIRKIIFIGDRDQIPDVVFETISLLTAMFASSTFSNTPVNWEAVERVEERLRYLIAQTPTYEPLLASYF